MSCPNCQSSDGVKAFNYQYVYSTNCTDSTISCGANDVDSKCVGYYAANLPCSGIMTKDSIELALQKIETAICNATGNYSTYSYHCLTPVTTEAAFVDQICNYVCTLNTTLNTFTGTTFPAYQATITADLAAITSPALTCSTAGVTSADSLSTILTKYCTQFSNIASAISLSGVTWNACYTQSTPTTIAGAFSAVLSQICQTKTIATSAATLPVFNNTSTCLPSPGTADTLSATIGKIISVLCAAPTFSNSSLSSTCVTIPSTATDLTTLAQNILTKLDALIKAAPTFSSDFVVTNVNNSNLCLGKNVALASTSTFNRYVAATSTDTTPGTLQSKLTAGTNISLDYTTTPGQAIINAPTNVTTSATNSVSWSGVGTSGSPLQANVKVSATAGNAASIYSDGIYVSPLTPTTYSFIPTATITPSVDSSNNVTMNAKIDTSQPGNILTMSSNGLYAPAPQSIATIVTAAATSTLQLVSTPGSGATYALTGSVIISPTATHQVLVAKSDGLAVQVSSTAGNVITINSDGIYAPAGAAQVNSDWNAVSGVAQILNKPTFVSSATGTSNQITVSASTGAVTFSLPSAVTISGAMTAGSHVTTGGTSSQFTKGDGSLDSNTYATTSALSTAVSGTTNYIPKFSSSSALGNSVIYQAGSSIAIGSTTANSTLDITGTTRAWITQTWSSGTSYAASYHNIPTYTGSLTSSNASYSAVEAVHSAIFNGNTTVASTTPFGTILGATQVSFSNTGTVTASSPLSCIVAQTQDLGTVNGTVSVSAGVEIKGVLLVTGATATITRTNHYQLYIQDTNQFGNGGNITNKFAIYQAGTNDISRFFGQVQNASSSVQFTSDIRVKENITPFSRGLKELNQINVHTFNYIYNKGVGVTGVIAQELEAIIPEAVKQGNFDLPDGSQSFTDFRMVDQTVLFYTMLQSIKDLSLEVEALKAKLPA